MMPVLYVEDERNDVYFMRHVWRVAGIAHPLITFPHAQAAMDYLSGKGAYNDREKYPLPCLILLDLNLPGLSGFDLLRWVRRQPWLQSMKVVVISGSNQERDVQLANSLGVADYIVKPPELDRLEKLIFAKKDIWFAHAPQANQ